MKKYILQWIVFAALIIATLGSFENPFTNRYLNRLEMQSLTATAKVTPLYSEISHYASKHRMAPIDAKIDRVWKAIPGYNGLEVDVKASYQKMKKANQFDEKDLVYKQVPPKVHLSDLPPSPIYRGNPNKPMVSFLINVAWGNDYIPQILKVLNKYHIKTTFFLDGSWVKNNPDLAMMISEEGHEIGNHAYTHPDLKQLTNDQIKMELDKTNDVIEATLDIKPKWFAPPSGSLKPEVVSIADQLGMGTIMWTVDTVDWKKPQPLHMVERVASKVESGSMILMHPTQSTADGIEMLITNIKQRGYRIGTVSELLSERRVQKEVNMSQ